MGKNPPRTLKIHRHAKQDRKEKVKKACLDTMPWWNPRRRPSHFCVILIKMDQMVSMAGFMDELLVTLTTEPSSLGLNPDPAKTRYPGV